MVLGEDNELKEITQSDNAEIFLERVKSIKHIIDGMLPKPLSALQWQLLLANLKKLHDSHSLVLTQESLGICEKYLTYAKGDARAAKILNEHVLPALTVYHLQQVVEKATKAFCLLTGLTTSDRLIKDHRTPQPLLQALEQDLLKGIRSILGSFEGKDYRKILRDVNRLVNNEPQVLAKLPFSSSRQQIGIDTLLHNFDIFSQKNLVLEGIENRVVTTLAEHLPEYREVILATSVIAYGRAAVMCYVLGALTFAHESPTRYPGGYLEPEDYKGDLGIVQAIPHLIERTPLLIASVEEVLRYVQRNIQNS